MPQELEIQAQARPDCGTRASRRLRREAMVPAVLYGGDSKPQNLTIEHRLLSKALENEAFYASVVTVNIDNTPVQAVLKAIQRHPYKPKITHVDFLRVDPTRRITMRVPLRFTGADVAPGIKLSGGIVAHLLTDVEVQCEAQHLPDSIEVDLSQLEVDQAVHLSDLKLSEGVTLVALAQGMEHNLPVASIHVPRGSASQTESTAGAESSDKADG